MPFRKTVSILEPKKLSLAVIALLFAAPFLLMPGMRGTDLARQVSELHPGIHVIYMSDMRRDSWTEPIPADASFLQKPFRFASLIEQLKLVPRKV